MSYAITYKGRYLASYQDPQVAAKVRQYVQTNFNHLAGSQVKPAFQEAIKKGLIEKPRTKGGVI